MLARTSCLVVSILLTAMVSLGAGEEEKPKRPPFDPCKAVGDSDLFKPMTEISAKLELDDERMPPDCASSLFAKRVDWGKRDRNEKYYAWEPTNFFHRPLYFDDVPLERYGQSKCPPLQPIASGARFFLTLPILPYKFGVDRPHDCVTTLGHRPPGSCVPCIKQTIPYETDAALLQAATTLGLVLVLP